MASHPAHRLSAPASADDAAAPSGATQSQKELADQDSTATGSSAPQPAGIVAEESAEGILLCRRYRLLEKLGAGAMGTVYRAHDQKLDRQVAIKLLPQSSIADAEAIARFQREAKALAKLSHPHIVQAYDADEDRGCHFLVMELVAGQTLAAVLREKGPLSPTRAATFGYQAALGLAHAHERGLVHRDFKPSNLLRTADGQVKILDLGLARFLQDQIGDATLTTAGLGMGTPDYMAPEQFHDARRADARSDIYSLGCTLYHLIAGRVPFPTSSLSEKFTAHEQHTPTPLEELSPDVPAGLAAAIGKMMAKRPEDRFPTALAVAEALAPYIAGSSHALSGIRPTSSWHGSQLGAAAEAKEPTKMTGLILGATGIAAALGLMLVVVWSAGWLNRRPSPGPPPGPPLADLRRRNTLSDPRHITVSQDGRGQFRSASQAVLSVQQPNTTIQFLDDKKYDERLIIFDLRCAGLTIEAPGGATLVNSNADTSLVEVGNVPGVTIRGLRLRSERPGQTLVGVKGPAPGLLLDGLHFEGAQSDWNGVQFDHSKHAAGDAPATVQSCVFIRPQLGVVLFGGLPGSLSGCTRIVVKDNWIREPAMAGIALLGHGLQSIQVVGNQVYRAKESGMRLVAGSQLEDLLIANNTCLECQGGIVVGMAEHEGKRVELANNLVLGTREVDFAFLKMDDQFVGQGPGDVSWLRQHWQIRNNWREVPEFIEVTGIARIPPASGDRRLDRIELPNRHPDAPDFLQPPAGSPLGTGGAGGDLPGYVGALPPPGVLSWDWQKTWNSRHPLLTVSQLESAGGQYRTVGEALKEVTRPNTTIWIRDGGNYVESLRITKAAEHAGLRIGSQRRPTLTAPTGASSVLLINGVPDVRVTGLRLVVVENVVQEMNFGIIAGGSCTNLLLEDVEVHGETSFKTTGLSVEDCPLAASESPVVVHRCTFTGLQYGVAVLGKTLKPPQPRPVSGVCLRECSVSDCDYGVGILGLVNRLLVCGNRIWDCRQAGLGMADLVAGSGQIAIVNNSIAGKRHCLSIEDLAADVQEVEVVNNLWAANNGPDIQLAALPTKINAWQIHHTWRQLPPDAAPVSFAADDRSGDAGLISLEPASAEFLHPSAKSPLVTGGAGGDLPPYIGAVPPAGVPIWDWQSLWQRRFSRRAHDSKP